MSGEGASASSSSSSSSRNSDKRRRKRTINSEERDDGRRRNKRPRNSSYSDPSTKSKYLKVMEGIRHTFATATSPYTDNDFNNHMRVPLEVDAVSARPKRPIIKKYTLFVVVRKPTFDWPDQEDHYLMDGIHNLPLRYQPVEVKTRPLYCWNIPNSVMTLRHSQKKTRDATLVMMCDNLTEIEEYLCGVPPEFVEEITVEMHMGLRDAQNLVRYRRVDMEKEHGPFYWLIKNSSTFHNHVSRTYMKRSERDWYKHMLVRKVYKYPYVQKCDQEEGKNPNVVFLKSRDMLVMNEYLEDYFEYDGRDALFDEDDGGVVPKTEADDFPVRLVLYSKIFPVVDLSEVAEPNFVLEPLF